MCRKIVVQSHCVEGEVVERLFTTAPRLEPGGDDEARWRGELARVERDLADLDHRYHVDGVLSRVDYFAGTDRLRAAEQEARVALARQKATSTAVGPLRDRWEGMEWHEQRETLRRLVTRVWVDQAARKGHPFDGGRVRVDWTV